jgi:protein involved in polysaccharide export with SLBB domain
MTNIKLTKLIVFLFIFNFFSAINIYSQVDYFNVTGAKRGFIDTLAFERSEQISKENQGLIEKEIEADKYIVGPFDEFSISFATTGVRDIKAEVSPDGNLILKSIGIVNLKNKKLSEAYRLIIDKIKSIYKTDNIFVALTKLRSFKVTVSGIVQKPTMVSATAVDRVSEIIDRAGGFKEESSIRKITLIRSETNERINIDLQRYYSLSEKDANPFVLGGDHIIVNRLSINESIELSGEVPSPIECEFVQGDKLSDLIKFGQGFLNSSFLDSVEVSRYNPKTREFTRFYVNLTSWKDKIIGLDKLDGDLELVSGDKVYVKKIRDWEKIKYVFITGEVNYPGYFSLNEGKETVADLLSRAGGFKVDAAIEAVEYIRQAEADRKDEELIRLDKILPSEMSKGEQRYYQAKIREKRGAIAINFNKILKDFKSDDNILLVHKDSIIVPRKKDYINIQGRVNNPGIIPFNKNFSYEDYIILAGGYGFRADIEETFITKYKGEQFLAKNKDYVLEPGDAILVPPEKEASFIEVFTDALTITTQLVTIMGVVLTIVNISR